MNYYFYGGDDKYKGSYLKRVCSDYVGSVESVDDNFFDEAHNCDYIYAFRKGLSLDMVSKLNLAYIGSLEELL